MEIIRWKSFMDTNCPLDKANAIEDALKHFNMI